MENECAGCTERKNSMGFLNNVLDKAKDAIGDNVADKVRDAIDDNLDDVLAKLPADKRGDILKLLESGKADAAIDKICEVAKVDRKEAKELVEKLKGLLE